MPETFRISVNGAEHLVEAEGDTPLLYVLRNDLRLNGPQFGCGLAQCGACTAIVDGEATRTCVFPLAAFGAASVVTIEGLGTVEKPHALRRANCRHSGRSKRKHHSCGAHNRGRRFWLDHHARRQIQSNRRRNHSGDEFGVEGNGSV